MDKPQGQIRGDICKKVKQKLLPFKAWNDIKNCQTMFLRLILCDFVFQLDYYGNET